MSFKNCGPLALTFSYLSPVPDIRWRKVLEPMPSTAEISTSGAVLKIFNIQLEDEGTYECEAENIRGKDKHQARIYVQGRDIVLIFHTFNQYLIESHFHT